MRNAQVDHQRMAHLVIATTLAFPGIEGQRGYAFRSPATMRLDGVVEDHQAQPRSVLSAGWQAASPVYQGLARSAPVNPFAAPRLSPESAHRKLRLFQCDGHAKNRAHKPICPADLTTPPVESARRAARRIEDRGGVAVLAAPRPDREIENTVESTSSWVSRSRCLVMPAHAGTPRRALARARRSRQ